VKIYLDFSVLSEGGPAVGRMSGAIDFIAVPPIGSSIALTRTSNGVPPIVLPGFTGFLRVEALRFEPSTTEVSISASLEDVFVRSVADGLKLMRYLADGFGLFAEEYDLGN
jgi:hypothetical protein